MNDLRNGKKPKNRRFWIERTKKGGKDSDLAIIVLWLIAFAKRPFYMEVGAADKKQAAIVKDRISHLLHWNTWLNEYIEIVQWEVRSTKKLESDQPLAKLQIVSSEIAGAHGGTPDLLIINELSHVVKWEFAENLMANADGVPSGMVIIATNAGFKGTKAEVWKNNAIDSDLWNVHIWGKPAPWHDKLIINDAKNRESASRYKRLWWGVWASGKGDALDENDIIRCFSHKLKQLNEPEDGWIYVAGLDLGVKHDHAGLMIIGISVKLERIKTVYFKSWRPSKGKDVDLMEVEECCARVSKIFMVSFLFYDPSQAILMAQRLRKQGVPAREMSFQKPGNVVKMATSFLQVVETEVLWCYDDDENTLRHDFGKFNIVEKSYGHKLESVSDEFGHADIGTALIICLPFAIDVLEGVRGLLPDDDLVLDEDPTEEDYEEMPQEFRDMYDMHDKEQEQYESGNAF